MARRWRDLGAEEREELRRLFPRWTERDLEAVQWVRGERGWTGATAIGRHPLIVRAGGVA